MSDYHIGSFSREEHCNCTPDAGIATGDQGYFLSQLLGPLIKRGLISRSWGEFDSIPGFL
jgi:hypothetical protein